MYTNLLILQDGHTGAGSELQTQLLYVFLKTFCMCDARPHKPVLHIVCIDQSAVLCAVQKLAKTWKRVGY
eukprot:364915-Chlamydomonas_euryale.AAC.18